MLLIQSNQIKSRRLLDKCAGLAEYSLLRKQEEDENRSKNKITAARSWVSWTLRWN